MMVPSSSTNNKNCRIFAHRRDADRLRGDGPRGTAAPGLLLAARHILAEVQLLASGQFAGQLLVEGARRLTPRPPEESTAVR